jgi:hypothetical protein
MGISARGDEMKCLNIYLRYSRKSLVREGLAGQIAIVGGDESVNLNEEL